MGVKEDTNKPTIFRSYIINIGKDTCKTVNNESKEGVDHKSMGNQSRKGQWNVEKMPEEEFEGGQI